MSGEQKFDLDHQNGESMENLPVSVHSVFCAQLLLYEGD